MGIDQQAKSMVARKEVMLTHAIARHFRGSSRASASMEMSIVHNLFLKNFRLI